MCNRAGAGRGGRGSRGVRRGPAEARPGARAVPGRERRERQHQQHRLGHAQQPHDPLGRDVQQVLPECQDPDRGQGVLDGAPGAHRRHGPARAHVQGDEGHGGRRVREEVRLQADSDPHGCGRSRGLRQQGQPRQVPDARAGGRRLLEVAARRPQGGRQDLGPARPDRRVGRAAARPLRPQLGLGNLRLLQGARAEERRLQGRGQGAAGLGLRGPGRHGGPVRDRL